jgi:threonine-phosphate decarboxylase
MNKDIHTFAEELKKNLSRVTDVSAGISPLGPSGRVKAAIRKAAKDIDLYADQECRRLKTYFTSKFGIPPDCIFFANSLDELIFRCTVAFKPAAVRSPGAYQIIGQSLGQSFGELNPGDLLIISNPNRITGKLSDRQGISDLVKTAGGPNTPDAPSTPNTVILLDESLIEFTNDDSFFEAAGISSNLIVLRTTANFYGLPGLELAYAVSSPQTIARLKDISYPGLNQLAIEAARTALKDKTYIKATRNFIRDERRELFSCLRKISGLTVFDSDANVFLIKVGADREKVVGRLNRAGFLIRDCGDIEGLDNTYLRMSVMSRDKNKKLVRILKEALAGTS